MIPPVNPGEQEERAVPGIIYYNDRLSIFVKGVDNKLHYKSMNIQGEFSNWENLGGELTSGIAVTSMSA